jgi:organic radical activating enzyme
MEKTLSLSIFPTSRCDTGCSHCMDNCNLNNPCDFTLEMAEQIVSEAGKEDSILEVLLTGYGEPLLNPNLLAIVECFASYKKNEFVHIITSGFSDKDSFRKSQFENLLKSPWANKIRFDHSFNLFHPSFPERLKNAIEMMLSREERMEISIRLCLAVDNYKETWREVESTIEEVAMQMCLEYRKTFFGWNEENRKKDFYWVQKFIQDDGGEYSWAVEFEAWNIPQFQFILEKGGGDWLLAIGIHPIVLEGIGRAEKMQNKVLDFICGAIFHSIKGEYTPSLTVMPDGRVTSECCNKVIYGKLGEKSLFEMSEEDCLFSKRLLPTLLSDKRMFEWRTRDTCRICQNLLAERNFRLS